MRPEIPTLPPVRFIRTLAAILAALLLAFCADNRVADGGSSSGVDNPSLTVGFVDASGTALRVSGDLDIYAADQNPAVDPEPLVTVKIKNSAFTNLTGNDFERLFATAASKRSAQSAPAAPSADSAITLFNIILKTQDRTGSLAFGFKYDSTAKAFTRTVDGGAIKRFDLRPKPLVRYTARVARQPVHGADGRVFVPGTPFLATLVDSLFVLENMPEGLFPLQLLAADGKVYPMPDSLNTLDSTLIYRPKTVPLGRVDTTGRDSIPPFTVYAGEPRQAPLDLPTILEGKLINADAGDARLSVVWRLIKNAADSVPRDTLPKDSLLPKPDSGMRRADIYSPTLLRTEVKFGSEGFYEFELRATIGLRTHADTVSISVARRPPPTPRIVKPLPGDSLVAGSTYNVQWEMPDKGPVTVSVSVDSGRAWVELARGYIGKDKLPIYPWTPSKELGTSNRCLLRVRSETDTTQQAGMEGLFRLLQ
jgi:hypothetical protein